MNPVRVVSRCRQCAVLGALLVLAPLVATPRRGSAQDVGPDQPETRFNQGAFRFAAQARAALHQLWKTSIEAKQERVACLGGHIENSVVYITHVQPVESTRADSANISAIASLEMCGPPAWFGTVHTHIATFQGQPFTIFSAPDRMVMTLWRNRWKESGVFCLLYSEADANCEFGYALASRASYGYSRGNNLLF